MPIEERLNPNMSQAQFDAIRDAIEVIRATLEAVADIQLSNEERRLPSISENREPFAQDTIENLAPLYPNLVSLETSTAVATNNWRVSQQIKSLRASLVEALDRMGDLEINTEWIVVRFMNDFYRNARDYRARNVPGANAVYDRLKPYYQRFGSKSEGDPDTTDDLGGGDE